MVSRPTKMAASLFIVLVLLLVFEVLSFAIFSVTGESVDFRVRVFYPASLTDAEIHRYLDDRDANLGWPWKTDTTFDIASHRQRVSPANDAIENPKYCFEVYGDSFTFADDVDNDAAWPNRLAESTGCKVLNFGVGGYGVDQAVLRHELNARFADYVALVIFPHDIRRNLNRHRSLIGPGKKLLDYKPRFVQSEDGDLKLIEVFSGTPDDHRRVFSDPSSGLLEERFLPDSGGLWSKITPSFPYTLTTLRLTKKIFREIDFEKLWTGEFERGMRGINFPPYYFHDEGLLVEAKKILEKLASRFQYNCKAKRQTCFVILHPDVDSIMGDFRADRMMAYHFENIKTRPYFRDMTAFLQAEMKGEVCRYFGVGDCFGHLNDSGNELVSTFFLRTFPAAFRN